MITKARLKLSRVLTQIGLKIQMVLLGLPMNRKGRRMNVTESVNKWKMVTLKSKARIIGVSRLYKKVKIAKRANISPMIFGSKAIITANRFKVW